MGKLVYTYKEFIVIEDDYKDGHIIINTKGKYHNHGHVKYLGTCKNLLKMIDKKIIPYSPYLRGTVLRISLDEKYKQRVLSKVDKDNQKPKFYKVQKGVRK
ncbi:hypothetical protein [Tissierella pigra]|uniref:Uncharacterized protein n=1 Tax=Tissierella pigra TaxID=2607614 RepID=A0A6N7Y0E8_9FIRM|nr:hypothetical protein [Tissierella pigra]MSU01958.1 hypothetical protein [Tissierella pigra]